VKTETSSFRLEKETFEDFKKYAKNQGITTNAMINKIMKEFMEWGSKAPELEFIPYPSALVIGLLSKYTEDEIRKIASDYAKTNFTENILFMKNEESVDAYLEYAKNWCDACGFAYSTKEKNESRNFTIRHNQGKKFSIFLDEIIKAEIEILTKKRAEVKLMANSVSFWI